MINTTTVRAIALGMSLGFALAIVPSCGTKPPTAKCNRNTCEGCCDAAGDCFKGISPEACGLDGITCAVCKTGQSCSAEGQCRNPGSAGGGAGGNGGGTSGSGGGTSGSGGGTSGMGTGGGTGGGVGTGGGMGTGGGGVPACSNLTCANGCCNPVNGTCAVGDQNTQCGGGGLACKVCNVGAGQTCMNGACVGGNCDPTTCPTGCCSNNVCVTNISANQCGLNGAACVTCQGANPACDLDAGVCLGGGTGGGSGGTGGFGGFGGFGGSGGLPDACELITGVKCSASGKCCDLFLCVNAGAACSLSGGTTCNATTFMCQ